jgi:hypothetical protein
MKTNRSATAKDSNATRALCRALNVDCDVYRVRIVSATHARRVSIASMRTEAINVAGFEVVRFVSSDPEFVTSVFHARKSATFQRWLVLETI